MKILFAGDPHGNTEFARAVFTSASEQDCAAVWFCGDVNVFFDADETDDTACSYTRSLSDLAQEFAVDVYFIDGNHDNFDLLGQVVKGSDAPVQIAPKVWYTPRGARLTFDNRVLLACGGAVSVDKERRIQGASWWPQEAITDADVMRCMGAPVDVLVCHDVPATSALASATEQMVNDYGTVVARDIVANRMRLGMVIGDNTPSLVIHGHIHTAYTQSPTDATPYTIRGLAHDGAALDAATYVYDTSTPLGD